MSTQKIIAEIIKSWVANSIYSQAQLARILGVSQPVFNLQLNGKNPFPVSRIKELVEILNPSSDDMEAIASMILGATPNGNSDEILSQIKQEASLKRRPQEHSEEIYKEIMKNKRALSQVFSWAGMDSDRYAELLHFIESKGNKLPQPSICVSTDLVEIIASHPLLDIKEKEKALWNVEWYKKTECSLKHFQNMYEGVNRQIFDNLSFLDSKEKAFVLDMIYRLRQPKEKKQYDSMLAAIYPQPTPSDSDDFMNNQGQSTVSPEKPSVEK